MEILDSTLNQIVNNTLSQFPDAEVYLFGSRARKDHNKNSDWDLLILLENAEISVGSEKKLMDTIYELELETGQVLSPFIYSKQVWNQRMENSSFFKNVTKEGIRIK